ncbi:hypothetical protein J1N09_14825 [Aureitalea sp. L0-47]|uniref:toxin-antitoxin system YwqK family antitoxin n=1 Tax=Aureitalea sp. L0-47 TaxID=2816962 RepID=UPI002237A521|nr:hypothetical protein [Aureitalea sp. L0-47]MCW5521120.1 hypothetical protein [Aureitalea sp. L0-47]
MNRFLILLFLVAISIETTSQNLNLNDLHSLCSKSKWETVNQILINKGWEYYSSEKGNSSKYNTITWSYKKESYSDEALAWFYLYTYEGFPNKVSLSFFNQEGFKRFQNSLSSNGYKLINSSIEDDELISSYSNSRYNLTTSTKKRKENDYSNSSFTAYRITVIKKESIYDPNNGKKVDTYANGNTKVEYVLKNGVLNGPITYFHENGIKQKIGYYSNGKPNGKFSEYDEDDNLTASYSFKNGFLEGLAKIYENGQISEEKNYRKDELDGAIKNYYYNDQGELFVVEKGFFKDGKKHGKWELSAIEEGKELPINITTFNLGKKEGFFREAKGDSLIVGNFKNDQLSGDYRIYYDLTRMLVGGLIRTDTTDLKLLTQGKYLNGEREGYWKNYHLTGNLASEGYYKDGLKHGEWKDYYTNYVSEKTNEQLPYSGELFLIQSYDYGYLEGQTRQFSYLQEVKYPCPEKEKSTSTKDSCTRLSYRKVDLKSNYKNDLLHGPYSLRDSLNLIVVEGNYAKGNKHGAWLQRYNTGNENQPFYYEKGRFANNERHGEWIGYYDENSISVRKNYTNDKLDGDFIEYDNTGNPKIKKIFYKDRLKELTVYSSENRKPEVHYKIIKEGIVDYRLYRTVFDEDGSRTLQEYYMTKNKSDKPKVDHNLIEIKIPVQISSNPDENYPDGLFQKFDTNDRIVVEGQIEDGQNVGKWEYNYYDSNVKLTINNKDRFDPIQDGSEFYYFLDSGELYEGIFTYFDPETGNKEERKIKDGVRNGMTIYYDDNGNKIKKVKYKNGVIK